MVNKSKEQFIEELQKDPDRLYKLGCILSLTGSLYCACLDWNDCSENASCEDCYNICWNGWKAIYQFQHNENELLGYYPKLRPLVSFITSKPEDNIKDAGESKGKQWLNDWGLALELAGLFNRGREFCGSLAQIMKEPDLKKNKDKWKEWQKLDCVKKFYDSTFDLSKRLYQAPLGIIAYCNAKENPVLRLLVVFCLLKEFRKMFIKYVTVSGPYDLSDGAFGLLGEVQEERALGKLAMAPLGKIIHCQFKTQDDEKLHWDIISPGWEKYERGLFDTWSYESGEYFLGNRVEDKAIWIMEPILQNMFEKMASDIEEFALPLLALDKFREETESVLKIIRNGLAKWHPCKIDWTYVKNLDSVIKSLQTKGMLLAFQVLEQQKGIKPTIDLAEKKAVKEDLLESIHKACEVVEKLAESELDLDNLSQVEMAYADAAVIEYLTKRFGEQDDALGNWPRDWHECPESFDLWKTKIREFRTGQAKASLDEVKRIAEAQPEHKIEVAETGNKDEPDEPLSWMSDPLVWKELPGSGEQWVGPFDPILRFHDDTESLMGLLTLKDCITHLKKILPYWIEYQFVSPKSDILADMTHTLRCWLIKVRHDSNQKLPPIPPDLIGMMDWIPGVEKMLTGGTTLKETDYTAQEQRSKYIKEPAVTERKTELVIEPTGKPQKSGPKVKYTSEKIKNMQTSFDKHFEESNDVKYTWNCVAEEHSIPSGKAAEMAVRRHQKKNK